MNRALWLVVLVGSTSWAAVNIMLGALVAPRLFAGPELDRNGAGAVFGSLLEHWTALAWWPAGVLALVLATIGLLATVRGRGLASLALVCALALPAGHWWLREQVLEVRRLDALVDTRNQRSHDTAATSDAHARFRAAHQASEREAKAFTLGLLALALVAGVASIWPCRCHQSEP